MSTSYESRFDYSDFHDSPEERLNRLKQLLDFKYEPSSIWKELLQNAEDAEASQLHFAVLPAHPKATHPFLATPILCALNDGAFSASDAHAIARMGLGTKGANEDAIGKFGLGMKSVFNIGEVLFYFASANQNAAREQHPDDENAPFGKALNPYAKLGANTSWNLDDGRKRGPLMKHLLQLLQAQNWCKSLENAQKPWFALMLPLRTETFAPRDCALVQSYPTPESLFPPDLEERLAALFPMLRHLERVSVWRESNTKKPDFSVAIQEGARRPQKPTELTEKLGQAQLFGGKLVVGKQIRRFEGQEIRLDLAEFAETGIEERGQNLFVHIEGEEKARLQREKFAPHAGAAWLQLGEPNILQLRPAVSLPLPDQRDVSGGQSDAQNLALSGSRGFQLTLHGNFFIDDGRRNLLLNAFLQGEEAPQSKWNKQLLRDGTLPLVLPALTDFLASLEDSQKPDDMEIRELVRALERAYWFIENPTAALTKNGNYLYKLSGPPAPDLTVSALKRKALEKAAAVGAWKLENDDEFWVLPAPPENEAAGALENPAIKIFEWFPALKNLSKKRILIWDWPRFTRGAAQNWSEDQILDLLKGAKGEVLFASPISARYFLKLLQSFNANSFSDEIWARLVELGAQGLRKFGFGARLKDEIAEVWREFWAFFVPRRFWLPFEIGTKEDRERKSPALVSEFLGELLDLDLARLPIPTELAPNLAPDKTAGDDGLWNADDATKIARWWGKLFAARDPKEQKLAGLARVGRLVEKTSEQTAPKFEILGAFALFKTKEWHDADKPKTGVLRSWQQLEALRLEERLWADTNLTRGTQESGAGWLRSWCAAIAVETENFVVSVEKSDQSSVEDLWPDAENQPQAFGAKACLQLLQKRPHLRAVKGRAGLVPRLFGELKENPNPQNQRAVRYLLHGRAENFADEKPPLFKAAAGGTIWHQLAQIVVPNADQWTLLEPLLTERISDDIAVLIGVRSLDKSVALDRLRERKNELASLNFSFSPAERHQILRDLTSNPNDNALFRALPLHEIIGQPVGSLPEKCFLEGAQISIPSELAVTQVLVVKPADEMLKARYQTFDIVEFRAQSVLELALLHNTPHQFTATILDTLADLDSDKIGSDIGEFLRDIPWLALDEYAFSPSQIAHLPSVQNEAEAILSAAPEIGATSGQVEDVWGAHCGWKKLTRWWPDVLDSARILAQALKENSADFAIGDLNFGGEIEKQLPRFLEGWRASGATLPRGVEFLQTLWESRAALEIAPALLGETPIEKLELWLGSLNGALENSDEADRKNPIVALHFWLFEALTKHPEARRNAWPDLLFPSKTGQWKPPAQLVLGARGVEENARLHNDWAQLVKPHPILCQERGSAPRSTSNEKAWDVLRAECALWNVTPELKAALIAVLGASPDHSKPAQELCSAYLENNAKQDARLKIWEQLGGVVESAQSDLNKAQRQPFYFRWTPHEKSLKTPNLLGEIAQFALKTDTYSSLLVGDILPNSGDGWHIELRSMKGQPQADKRLEMTDLIKETLRILVRERDQLDSRSTNITDDDQHQKTRPALQSEPSRRLSERLESCLAQWSESEQIDLEVAQKFMLDNAFFYFRTLSGKMGPLTRDLVRKNDAWRYENHSQIDVRQIANQQKPVEFRELLGDELEKPKFQTEIRNMVRQKIGDLGYDAASELLEAGLGSSQTRHLKISVDSKKREVQWRHFGRKLNVKGSLGTLSAEQVRERGYGRDLEKMLILQASDKSEQKGTTGKFGLGFKSLFLVADRPNVQSGELCFEVVGGFYPQASEAQSLEQGATQIGFAIDADADWDAIWNDFWRVLPLQLVFGRALGCCDFHFDDQTLHFAPQKRWIVENHLEIVDWGHSSAAPWTAGQNAPTALPARILLVRAQNLGVLALGLAASGVVPLPPDIPAIWATTPTRVPHRPGFALNADWAVDVGRVQLAGGDKNNQLAGDLARELGTSLQKLKSQKWPDLRAALELDSNLSETAFWQSVATVLAHPAIQNDALLRTIFDPKNGATKGLPLPQIAVGSPSELTPVSTPTSPIPSLSEVSRWWKTEKSTVFKTLEGPFFPPNLQIYEFLDSTNPNQKRQAWLTLLLRASLESVGRVSDEQKRNFIGFCDKNGWIERFSRSDADVSQLGKALEEFLDKDQNNHQWLYLLRHSLPVFVLSRWLDKYISIFSRLDSRQKFGDPSFLSPRTDSGFGLLVDVPDAPQLGHVLGLGAHFLLRELVRTKFVGDPRAHAFCFHPTASLRRVLEPFDERFARPRQNSFDDSKRAFQIFQQQLGEDANFDLCFDIPLVLWAQGKANEKEILDDY